MHRLLHLPPSVRGYLSDFVNRWRRVLLLRAVGAALAVFTIWTLLGCAADRLLHFPDGVRLAMLGVGGLLAFLSGVIRLAPLRGPVDWVAMAGVIEQYDPRFGQQLITVISRTLGLPEHRGSDEILSHLLRELELRAADKSQNKFISLRAAMKPWMLFAVAAILIVVLARLPVLGGPRLLARSFAPLADFPPVTTTALVIRQNQVVDVLPTDPLKIEVDSTRLGASPVWIYLNEDGEKNWSRYTMDDAGGGKFTFTINTVGRDLRYYVTGGDAQSNEYRVRVKRAPAVADFNIQYTYPAYTGKTPFTVNNSDGLIEAPAGSTAILTITATEPLEAALLSVGSRKILMDHAPGDDLHRTATLSIEKDSSYDLDLISTREIRGSGPGRMSIHATADRLPWVRLLQAGQSLRLNPRDVLPLTYQAMDDYGLDSLTISAQVNAENPVLASVRLGGDRRRQEDTVNFDLASLKLNMGDVVTVIVVARDTGGQEVNSDELRVLISPRSIDMNAHDRVADLNAASRFASTLLDEFDAASKAVDETDAQKDHQSASYLAAASRGSRHLSSASEVSTLLRQSLLRAASHSDRPELALALAGWIDTAVQLSHTADDLFNRGGLPDGMGNGARDRTHHAADIARDLYTQVRTAAQGEQATSVLADREDLKTSEKRKSASADPKAAERLAQTLQHANEDITAAAADMGINANSPDADNQLRQRVDSARDLVRGRQPVDFPAAARDWSQDLQHDPHTHGPFGARLTAAAQAEAVRPDSDLACARDLDLSARAVGAIEATLDRIPAGRPVPAGQLNSYVTTLSALHREHLLTRQPAGHSSDELKVARNVANRAREEMARWAGENAPPKNSAVANARPGDLEAMALRASAASIRHEYKPVAEADRALIQKLTDAARKPGGKAIEGDGASAAAPLVEERIQRIAHTGEQVARHMHDAETVDQLGQAQDKLAQESRSSRKASRELASRQRNMADQIAQAERQQSAAGFAATTSSHSADDPNRRGRATAALLLAQEELAAFPQELSRAQEAAAARRKAVQRADAAARDASSAPPERREMALRAADQADRDARDAADQLDQEMAAVAPEVASDLAGRLDVYSPEASAARDAVSGPLATALEALQAACDSRDGAQVSRAAADARKAINTAQNELSLAQDAFTERDPLVAAKWFARAAADSLARRPGDLGTALSQQASASLALSRAWDRSVHRAADLRLSLLPSMQAVYAPAAPAQRENTVVTSLSPNLSPRDWGRLHARDADDVAATLHEPDPPGYEEPLRIYFEALGKAQEKGGR